MQQVNLLYDLIHVEIEKIRRKALSSIVESYADRKSSNSTVEAAVDVVAQNLTSSHGDQLSKVEVIKNEQL